MAGLTEFLLGRTTRKDHLLAGLLVLSVAVFLFNGRSNQSYGDFAHVYASSRAAVLGMDPYKLSDMQTQLALGGADMRYFIPEYWPAHVPVYPPLTYYLVSPVGLLSFPNAGKVWFLLTAMALIVGCAMTAHFSPMTSRTFVVCGVCAVLLTSSVLLRLGQVSALAIGLLAMAAILFLARRHLTAGACLFLLAACLKPQLAIPLMVYFCFPRWTRKFALSALAAYSILLGISCLVLISQPQAAHWPAELSSNLNSPLISAVPVEELDTGLVNPQALFVLFTRNAKVYGTLTALLLGVVVVALVTGLWRLRENPARDWLAVGAISIVTLLLTYHRTYDMRMTILTLPALALLWRFVPRIAGVLTFLSCFLLISTAILLVSLLKPHLSHAATHGFIFRLLVERQQALFVLFTALAWVVVTHLVARRKMKLDTA